MALSLRVNPLRKTLKNASRLKTIVSVFAKHGFYKLAEQVRLGQFILDRLNYSSSDIEKLSAAERVRMSFEELGPTFVKLGQLLATRPDLVPEDYVREFEKLHAQVLPLPFATIESVLSQELGIDYKSKFLEIDPQPVGSASIAQVHRARLHTGEDVVIKVQRPGILQTISDDLGVLYLLAGLLYKYVPETRTFNPTAIVDEYFKTLELETNFIVEANNIRRFQLNLKNDSQVHIPKIYFDLTTEKVLVLEMMKGIPLTDPNALLQEGVSATSVIKKGLQVYLKMVFVDGLFHGDLHAGNFFVLPHNEIGLIDFGVIGRLNSRTQTAIASMLFALSIEDYDRLAYEYVDLAPFTDQVNVDLFAKELRELIAPYYGLTLKNINLGKLLMNSAAIASRHHILVPTELMMFFKSMIAIEGVGRRIHREFDFLQTSLEFAGELVKHQFDPSKITHELGQVLRESKNFLHTLPRQLHFLIRKLNSPNHHFRLQLVEMEEFKKSIESSFNLLFLGLIISSLIVSASVVATHPSEDLILGVPQLSFLLYSMATVLGVVSFFNYIRK